MNSFRDENLECKEQKETFMNACVCVKVSRCMPMCISMYTKYVCLQVRKAGRHEVGFHKVLRAKQKDIWNLFLGWNRHHQT